MATPLSKSGSTFSRSPSSSNTGPRKVSGRQSGFRARRRHKFLRNPSSFRSVMRSTELARDRRQARRPVTDPRRCIRPGIVARSVVAWGSRNGSGCLRHGRTPRQTARDFGYFPPFRSRFRDRDDNLSRLLGYYPLGMSQPRPLADRGVSDGDLAGFARGRDATAFRCRRLPMVDTAAPCATIDCIRICPSQHRAAMDWHSDAYLSQHALERRWTIPNHQRAGG